MKFNNLSVHRIAIEQGTAMRHKRLVTRFVAAWLLALYIGLFYNCKVPVREIQATTPINAHSIPHARYVTIGYRLGDPSKGGTGQHFLRKLFFIPMILVDENVFANPPLIDPK
jgi:hypothetical protein